MINLLLRLQVQSGLWYLIIARKLALARRFANRLAIMYLDQIVELTDRRAGGGGLLHPLPARAVQVTPIADPSRARERALSVAGDPPKGW